MPLLKGLSRFRWLTKCYILAFFPTISALKHMSRSSLSYLLDESVQSASVRLVRSAWVSRKSNTSMFVICPQQDLYKKSLFDGIEINPRSKSVCVAQGATPGHLLISLYLAELLAC